MIINQTKKIIRIAVVGCGRIADRHFEAIKNNSNHLKLIAICDKDEKALEQAKMKVGASINSVSNFTALLGNSDIDVVALCTPSGLHARQAIEAAGAGKHVVTEKPMATRWQDGVNMVRACDDAGVRLFVVKQNRYNTTLQMLKRAIMEKRFGKILMVHINVFWSRTQAYYDQAKWRGTWEFDGGALMNQASHYVDLLDWLIGPVEKVQAMVTTTRDIEVEDSCVLNIKWRNGALGTMSITMLTYLNNLEGSITVLGEKGTVRIGGVAANNIQIWQFDEPREYDEKIAAASYEAHSVYGYGHSIYYKNVVEVIRGEAIAETDGREGLKSLEIILAAYLSARDGKTVSLPLEY
jgi:UDP-N-acetyl-2-amino-2-deoxyglucuronate dehydrogenase